MNSLESYILSEMHGNVWYIVVVYRHLAPLTYSLHAISTSVTPPAVSPTVVPSFVDIPFDVSQLSKSVYAIWTAKNWMQYSASHVATTALLQFQSGLRS